MTGDEDLSNVRQDEASQAAVADLKAARAEEPDAATQARLNEMFD